MGSVSGIRSVYVKAKVLFSVKRFTVVLVMALGAIQGLLLSLELGGTPVNANI
jgi:hypothetical protein